MKHDSFVNEIQNLASNSSVNMYNKTLAAYNNNVQEVVISLEGSCFEKALYYRDEGNMNIVLSLFAFEDDIEKYVIRFKKVALDTTESNSIDHKHELMSFIHFEELLQKYFDHFTVVPKIAFLDVDVHALNEFLLRDRPELRRSKVIGHSYGLLYRDVAFMPKEIFIARSNAEVFRDSSTICIEIKVKQGYLMDDEAEFGVKKCRYCYFQYHKLKNARISSISEYCPIDLFSGNAERMNRAIKGLIDNPQNNLKIFQDGKMVYNEYSSDKSALQRILKSLFPDVISAKKQETLLVNLIRKILIKDFTCCDKDIDVHSLADCNENVHLRDCKNESFPQLSRNCVLHSIFKAQLLVRDNFFNMELLDTSNGTLINSIDDYSQIIQDYRMGSTALDCSVMVTFKRIDGIFDIERESKIDMNHHITFEASNEFRHHFVANANIVDLDEKKDSMAHFRKYKKQYRDSKIAYAEFIKSHKNKKCTD